jgi:hypothetical protein
MWNMIKWDEVVTGVVYTIIAATILGVIRLIWQKVAAKPRDPTESSQTVRMPPTNDSRITLTEAIGKTTASMLAITFQLLFSAMLSDIHNAKPELSTTQFVLLWVFWLLTPIALIAYRAACLRDEKRRSRPNASFRFWFSIFLHLSVMGLGVAMIFK